MKVFVLSYDNGFEIEFQGVYSTKEKVEEKIKQFADSYRKYFDINEVEIDEELR